jgi:ABC-type dipeptide/oligopeptide/nickel transport system permease component
MLRFVLRRAASALLTLLGVLALVFGLLAAAPGDPASMAARAGARAAAASPEALAAFRSLYGLDRPAPERFGLWILRAARLDFGVSLSDGRPVAARIAGAMPATVVLNLAALVLALALGVPAGIGAARRPGGRLDRLSGAVGDALFATPAFVLGLVLLLVFSGWLRWTPLFADADAGGFRGYVLPVVTLALPTAAFLARFVRACVASALRDPATAAARARGEGSGAAVRRALRRSAAPFAAMGAALVPSLVSGSVLVERVFSLAGAGGLLADAVFARDVPTVLALALLSAGAVVAASLLADVASAALDPRARDADAPLAPAGEAA